MRAIVIESPGSYDRLRIQNVPDPILRPGTVRVKTTAIGVNFADCVVRMGLYESAKKYVGWPITPGFEFAGVVDEIAEEVNGLEPGRRVLGVSRFGAYASSVVVASRQLFDVPEGWSDEQAASFPVAFLTAWYALRELSKLRPGNQVLIHSGAGGVGGAAVQIVRACDCQAIAVVGAPHKVAAARALGASHVIDKSREPLWTRVRELAPRGLNVVLDPNGVETLGESYQHLAPTGRLVVYGFHTMLSRGRGRPNWAKLATSYLRTPRFQPLRLTNDNKAVLGFNLSYLFDQLDILDEAMSELLAWVAAGRLRPLPIEVHELGRAADAHRALETGSTTGKLVLVPRAKAHA